MQRLCRNADCKSGVLDKPFSFLSLQHFSKPRKRWKLRAGKTCLSHRHSQFLPVSRLSGTLCDKQNGKYQKQLRYTWQPKRTKPIKLIIGQSFSRRTHGSINHRRWLKMLAQNWASCVFLILKILNWYLEFCTFSHNIPFKLTNDAK